MNNIIAAVMDLGSNSFRLQVSEVVNETYKVVDEYKEVPRLGDVVYSTGKFTPESIQTMIGILNRMKVILDKYPQAKLRTVGTALFRDASNTREVLGAVKDATGFDIDVISGEDEAKYTYLAASGYIDLSFSNVVFVDIGGGSMELSYSVNGELVQNLSTPLGCSRITQHFVPKNKARHEDIKEMTEYIKDELRKVPHMQGVDKILFTGGTVNMLAQVYSRRKNLPDGMIKHVDSDFINRFILELAGKTYEERGKIAGVEPDRADISLAAAVLVHRILKLFHMKSFFSFSGGLRNGITIDMLNKMGHHLYYQTDSGSDLRYSKLVETGRKFSFEEEHAINVSKISKILFTQLYKLLELEQSDWPLLEAAGMLHDIGQHISYSKHHKHTHYLISNMDLVGYTYDELNIIANVARYHRKSMPSKNHPEYALLTGQAKEKVKKLAAILRIADSFDNSRTSPVENVYVTMKDDKIIFNVKVSSEAGVEVESFNSKKDLLEKVTGMYAQINIIH